MLSSQTSLAIPEEKFNCFVNHLKNKNAPVSSNLKYWIKTKKLALIDVPALNLVDVLTVPNPAAAKTVKCIYVNLFNCLISKLYCKICLLHI